jgi:xanthine/uracil permease
MVPSGVLLVYMVLIGIVGKLKEEGGTRFTLLVSGGGLAVTLVAAAVFYWYRAGSTFAVALLMMVAACLAVPALYAVLHLSPRSIARLVAAGLLAAALLDASFIFGASKGEGLRLSEGLWGLFTVALIGPAALLMRMLPPPEEGPPELPGSPFAGGVRDGSL